MDEREYKEALVYYRHVEKDKGGNPLLTCGAWEKTQKKEAKRFIEVEPQISEPKHQNKSDFMEEASAFWIKARRHWSEEVIEEVLDKARVNTR